MSLLGQTLSNHCCICAGVCGHTGGPSYCEMHNPLRPTFVPVVSLDTTSFLQIKELRETLALTLGFLRAHPGLPNSQAIGDLVETILNRQ